MDDLEKLIKPEDIQKLTTSQLVRKAVAVLGSHRDKDATNTPTQTEYWLERDHLGTRFITENAYRAGNLANMTLGELTKARPDEGQMVVTVKTQDINLSWTCSSGTEPNHLKVAPGLWTVHAWMSCDDPLFIGLTANTMSSSMVSAQLNSIWQNATDKYIWKELKWGHSHCVHVMDEEPSLIHHMHTVAMASLEFFPYIHTHAT